MAGLVPVADVSLSTSVTNIVSYLNSAVSFITGNEICMLFLAGAIVSLALGLFGKAKRVVR